MILLLEHFKNTSRDLTKISTPKTEKYLKFCYNGCSRLVWRNIEMPIYSQIYIRIRNPIRDQIESNL